MAWWVPLLCFLLTSWKEPPAHPAEAAEAAKTQSLNLGKHPALPGHLHFWMPSLEVSGDQIRGTQGMPTLGALQSQSLTA